jgi:hypothetical protein
MPSRRKSKKRPCRICRKWFMPHPRVGDRQKTCGDHECMRKWHGRKCAEWNRKNRNCAQEKYLSDRLALGGNEQEGTKATSAAATTPQSHVSVSSPAPFPQLPRSLIQEVIGVQEFVIIEYIARQLFRSVQEVIKRQHFENTRDPAQLPPRCRSRCDSVSRRL